MVQIHLLERSAVILVRTFKKLTERRDGLSFQTRLSRYYYQSRIN